ncbi:MAG TPA: carboxypeptidase regulatory-like domain-containing protein [Pyrinomonadaceae bacterium]
MKLRLLMLVAVLLGLSLTAVAQTSRGTVSGTVTDPTGAVIAGANVVLTNTQTGVERTTTSSDEGQYRFEAVDLGTYNVKITASGFGEVTKTNLSVTANQTAEVSAQMAPAGQTVVVDVTTEGTALLQTEAPVRGGNIETAQIQELPFAGRNPVALALTLPGVSTNRFGFGVGTFSVNGARGRSNNFLIDGTENNDISVAGQGFQITNPDAVQEVSVQTSNYDAEFGRAGGAVVNTITKSGTNEFHGTLSYLLDSTRDDAVTSAESRRAPVIARGRPLPGTEQWFAGTFGGPIVHNRTFFFGAFQEQRQNSASSTTFTIPTAAGRARLRQLFPVGASPNLDLYFNVIGDAVATTSPINIALGTVNGVNRGNIEFGTYTRVFGVANRDRQFQIRVDHKIGDNDQFSSRYLFDDQIFPFGGNVGFEGFDAPNKNTYQNFLLAETHIFSPNLTNEARIAYNRILIDFPVDTENPLGNTLPTITLTTASGLGVASNLPQGRVANNYVFQDTVSLIRGDHNFRFGLDILNQRSKQLAPFRGRGELTFGASNAGGQTFTSFANFVDNFGGSGSALRDFGSAFYYPELIRQAYFFQDRWNATQNLTLTLGIRYENFGVPFNSLRTPAFTGLFNVDPVTGVGPWSEPNSIPHDNNNFAPTFGLAYSPSYTSGFLGDLLGDKQTVFRMGYQIGYDSFFNNIASNSAATSPNLISTSTVSTPSAANPRGLANLTGSFPTTARALTPLDSQTLSDPNLVNPYYQRWSAGFQRSLPFNIVLDMSYVGSKGTHLYNNEDRNPVIPASQVRVPAGYNGPPLGAAGSRLNARLDPLQGARLTRANGGDSIYHSGQLQVTRRFSDNYFLSGSYTWSKLIDNASEVFGTAGNNAPQNQARPVILFSERLDRAVSLFDRRHRASIVYGYQIPFFREQRGFVGRLLGGFEITGITTFESGAPLNVFNGTDADGIGGNFDRPDFNPAGEPGTRAVPFITTAALNPCGVAVGTLVYTTGPSGAGTCINPANAQYIGLLGSIGRTGNLGRNTLVTPGTNNWNVNILKRVKITENTRLEFRTEFYNIFNHPQYTQGSVSPFSPAGGSIPATVNTSLLGEFLNPNTRLSDGGGRVIRYQLKFTF